VKGGIPIAFRACGGVGQLLNSLLGQEGTPMMVGACVRLRYTGPSASCKIVPANGPVTVLCGAGGVDNVNYDGAYFLLSNGVTTFYVWTDVGAGSTDPGAAGQPLNGLGYTGAEVDIATGTSTDDIATAIEAVVEALTGINSTVLASTVSITAATTAYSIAGLGVSAVFTVTNTGTLTSRIGTLGAEAVDAAFGTAGVIDLANAATDTVGELVAVIEAYADYEAELVTGAGTVKSGSVQVFVSPGNYRQGKNTWVYLWFGLPGSTVYKHEFPVQLTDTERPVYSIQKDGYQDNFLYDGCVVDRLSLSGALKGMVEADVDILGMKETGSQVASSLALEDVDPMLYWHGSTSVGAVDYTYARNMSLEFRNNHMPDGYGQGLVTRQYQQKAKFECTGELKLRLDSDSFAERAKVFASSTVAVSLWLKGGTIVSSIDELCIIELAACAVSAFKYEENNGVFDAGLSIKAISPKGTVYNDPVTVTILTTNAGAY